MELKLLQRIYYALNLQEIPKIENYFQIHKNDQHIYVSHNRHRSHFNTDTPIAYINLEKMK